MLKFLIVGYSPVSLPRINTTLHHRQREDVLSCQIIGGQACELIANRTFPGQQPFSIFRPFSVDILEHLILILKSRHFLHLSLKIPTLTLFLDDTDYKQLRGGLTS